VNARPPEASIPPIAVVETDVRHDAQANNKRSRRPDIVSNVRHFHDASLHVELTLHVFAGEATAFAAQWNATAVLYFTQTPR
jgi:hypothetical protein